MNESKLSPEVEILKKLVNADEVKETHISYALMTDDYVYKVKKAVDFGFLDYKSAKDRRKFSILEKELNERFSKGIYLEVMKLVRRSKDSVDLVPVENTLTALEYVLKMKRIADKDFLANRIDSGLVSIDDMAKIGEAVALLLKNLEPAPKDDEFGSTADVVKFNAVENFNQTEKYVKVLIDEESYNFIQRESFKFLADNKDVFNLRGDNGYVKNGHGDLRLEHIYFNPDGSVGLIDCIEFNKRFRYIDSVAEAAFLSMELDYMQKTDYADAFLTGFLSVFNDMESLKMLHYYKSYLAYVRAKVTCFLLDDKNPTWEHYDEKVAEIKRLIDMSAYYASSMNGVQTPIFYGIMGTGKSRNAKCFANRFPVFRVNSDEVRKRDAGVSDFTKVYENYGEGLYTHEKSLEVYDRMAKIVEQKNAAGRACIVDASFIEPEFHSTFSKREVGKIRNFQFTAPDDVILARLHDRLEKGVVSDGRPAIYAQQKEHAKMPIPELLIETTGDVSDNIDAIFRKIIS